MERGLVVLLAVVGLAVLAPSADAHGLSSEPSRVDALLSKAVSNAGGSALPGDPIHVDCWSPRDWSRFAAQHHFDASAHTGYVNFHDRSIELTTARCDDFVLIEKRDRWPTGIRDQLRLSNDLRGLMTDAASIRGADTDASANCYAAQLIRPAALSLGMPSSRAAVLSLLSWRYLYPREPQAARSVECHRGGQLDLGLSSNRWP